MVKFRTSSSRNCWKRLACPALAKRHTEKAKRSGEKDLIDILIHDLGKEDLVDRFVKLQMVNQEREEQLERQQYQIEHLTKFLKQADETLRDAITVAERDARI